MFLDCDDNGNDDNAEEIMCQVMKEKRNNNNKIKLPTSKQVNPSTTPPMFSCQGDTNGD